MAIRLDNAITRGERFAQKLRPASLLYAGKTIPVSTGNQVFYQRLNPKGGGFSGYQSIFVKILRADIPKINGQPIQFTRGQRCQLRNDDADSPYVGEVFDLVIGEQNQLTAMVLILTLESVTA